MGKIRDTTAALPAGLPRELRAFLEEEGLPNWADRARLLRAQRFAERNAVAIATALFCAALPSAFTGAKGVGVLYATGRLEHDVDARVNETGRFVFDVLMPGGFESGTAVRSTQKVRLLHASVRQRVSAGGASHRDVPINQEDLLGTLSCFSVVVLDALAAMGVPVTATEAEDYLHLWIVVGAMLGIVPRLLPPNMVAARALAERIGARQTASSSDGRTLTRVLLAGIERHLPMRGLGVLAPGLMRLFLGEEKSQLLGVPRGLPASGLSLLLSSARALLGSGPRGQGMLRALEGGLGRALLERTMHRKLEGRNPAYQEPLAQAACPFGTHTSSR